MGIFAGSTIGFKRRKDYINIFKLDVVIINIKKKVIILIILMIMRIIKRLKFPNLINIIINGRSLSFSFFSLLYGFGIIILLLKEENKLFILPV